MARDMTAEGQPISKKESIWDKKIPRRTIVGTAAAVAGAAAIYKLVGTGEEDAAPATNLPKEGAIAKEGQTPSVFGRLRERLAAANSVGASDKEELGVVLDKLEKIDTSIGKFIARFESDKMPEGTPRLLSLRMQRLESLDFGAAYPNSADWRKAWAEGGIFFLADGENMNGIKNLLLDALDKENEAALIDGLNLEKKRLEQGGSFSIDYLNVGSKPHEQGKTEVTIQPDALAADSQKAYSIKSSAESFLGVAPKVGDREVVVRRQSGGLHNRIENKMEVGLDSAYEDQNELIAHEFGHFLSSNWGYLSKYFSEGEIINAMVLEQELLGRFSRPPFLDRVLSDDKRKAYYKFRQGGKLNEDELMAYSAMGVDKRWVQEATFCDEIIGSADILDTSYSAGRQNRFASVLDFVNANGTKIQELASKHPILAELAADIKKRPAVYNNLNFMVSPVGESVGFVNDEKFWWQALPDMARAFYMESVLLGKVKATVEEVKKVRDHLGMISMEYAANSLGFAILYKDRLENPQGTIAGRYVASLS